MFEDICDIFCTERMKCTNNNRSDYVVVSLFSQNKEAEIIDRSVFYLTHFLFGGFVILRSYIM